MVPYLVSTHGNIRKDYPEKYVSPFEDFLDNVRQESKESIIHWVLSFFMSIYDGLVKRNNQQRLYIQQEKSVRSTTSNIEKGTLVYRMPR